MDIRFGPEILHDFAAASSREWLETNGIGGFALGSLSGVNTRRYHGLLIAATIPPVGRMVMVSKLEETVVVGQDTFEVSSNQYPGVVSPKGYRLLDSFSLYPCPTFIFRLGEMTLKKSVMMIHGENTTVVTYQLLDADKPISLRLRPLLACRDSHGLARENSYARLQAAVQPGLLTIQPYSNVLPVHIGHPPGRFTPQECWYRNFEYERDCERGLDFREDLMSPGTLELTLEPDWCASIVISARRPLRPADADDKVSRELARRHAIIQKCTDPLEASLRWAAESHLSLRGNGGRTIIAGYPWYSDWGRDTMISLPGLTLATGHPEIAREILETYSRYLDRGLIPNRFPENGLAPEYNTADASLWYAYAAERYVNSTRDREFARRIVYPTLMAIIAGYREGTRFNIRMTDGGLIHQGQEGLALTWMDAKVDDWVVTQRRGRTVELNALWYNALGYAADLAEWLEGPAVPASRELRRLQTRVRNEFVKAFWYEEGGYLYDLVDGLRRDSSIRPNQVFALALPRPILDSRRARSVFAVVKRELYTPLGLRSLSPSDPAYHPRFEGDMPTRDAAYHQGTVWGYLIGFYMTAYLNVHGRKERTLDRVRQMLAPFRSHLYDAGLGTVSEVFDGDEPFKPRGCISQAWSVAELLRVIHEELGGRL